MPESPDLIAARQHFPVYMALVHKTDTQALWDGQALPARHHREMMRALVNPELGHTLIVAPRGAAKTTLAQGWLEWSLGRASLTEDKDWAKRFRVIYLSHAATKAYQVSLAVMQTLEGNEIFKAIFPRVKPSPRKWSEPEWRVEGNVGSPHPTFQAGGIDSPPLGGRGDLIVLDDVADEKNMATPGQREKVQSTLEKTVSPMLTPWGRFVMLCTRWAWEDPAQWAMDQGWHPIYMKAILENEGEEESYWPERFPLDWLQNERRKNPRAFAQQYQNEVVPEEGVIFERAWFDQRFDYLPSEHFARPCSWDTAFGQGRNRSFSVGLSAVVTPDLHIYVHHMFRGQVPYTYLKDAIRREVERHSTTHVIIENKSTGQPAGEELHGEGLPIVMWRPVGERGSAAGKEKAREMVADFCRMGRLHLPSDYYCRKSGDPHWLGDFERELFSFPDAGTDDVVDALTQLIIWVKALEDRRVKLLGAGQEPVEWGESREVKTAV